MPCLCESWDEGLIPGTPEYAKAEQETRKTLEAILHIVGYYCTVHDREFPKDFNTSSGYDELPGQDKRLLVAIYHHLQCDRFNAAATHDALCFARERDEYLPVLSTIESCFFLARLGPAIKRSMPLC